VKTLVGGDVGGAVLGKVDSKMVSVWGLRAVVYFRGDGGYLVECIGLDGETVGGRGRAVSCEDGEAVVGVLKRLREFLKQEDVGK
jgi:hypothetical protein